MSPSIAALPKTDSSLFLAAIVAWSLVPQPAFAQANVEAMQGIQFDFLAPGARSLAMGGAFVAVADDATAALANPAGLIQLPATEVSAEGRFRTFDVPFVFGGRLSGQVTNIGMDTIPNPMLGEASDSASGLSFASIVFAGPQRSWAVAGYRHETVRFRTEFQTQGAFSASTTTPGASARYFPIDASTSVDIVNYGFSGAIKLGPLGIGGGLSFYDLDIDSLTSRYNLTNIFQVPIIQPNNIVNRQVLGEGGTGLGFNVGLLATPSPRFQLGFSYRHGADLPYTARNEPGPAASFQAFEQADPQFAMPHVTTAGVALRPGSATVVSVDYSFVQYSRIAGENFIDLFFNPQLNPTRADQGPTFSIDDANEFHAGFEHQFVNARMAPAVRFGSWLDPAHAPTTTGVDALLYGALVNDKAGEDVWHYTAGGGVTFGSAVVSAGFDFSDRGNIASFSLVFRFQ